MLYMRKKTRMYEENGLYRARSRGEACVQLIYEENVNIQQHGKGDTCKLIYMKKMDYTELGVEGELVQS